MRVTPDEEVTNCLKDSLETEELHGAKFLVPLFL